MAAALILQGFWIAEVSQNHILKIVFNLMLPYACGSHQTQNILVKTKNMRVNKAVGPMVCAISRYFTGIYLPDRFH
jgi:hypothetical protein